MAFYLIKSHRNKSAHIHFSSDDIRFVMLTLSYLPLSIILLQNMYLCGRAHTNMADRQHTMNYRALREKVMVNGQFINWIWLYTPHSVLQMYANVYAFGHVFYGATNSQCSSCRRGSAIYLCVLLTCVVVYLHLHPL